MSILGVLDIFNQLRFVTTRINLNICWENRISWLLIYLKHQHGHIPTNHHLVVHWLRHNHITARWFHSITINWLSRFFHGLFYFWWHSGSRSRSNKGGSLMIISHKFDRVLANPHRHFNNFTFLFLTPTIVSYSNFNNVGNNQMFARKAWSHLFHKNSLFSSFWLAVGLLNNCRNNKFYPLLFVLFRSTFCDVLLAHNLSFFIKSVILIGSAGFDQLNKGYLVKFNCCWTFRVVNI